MFQIRIENVFLHNLKFTNLFINYIFVYLKTIEAVEK